MTQGVSSGLSQRRPWFDTRSVHVRIVVGKLHWERVFSEHFCFALSVSFHQCSILISNYTLPLPEKQAGEA